MRKLSPVQREDFEAMQPACNKFYVPRLTPQQVRNASLLEKQRRHAAAKDRSNQAGHIVANQSLPHNLARGLHAAAAGRHEGGRPPQSPPLQHRVVGIAVPTGNLGPTYHHQLPIPPQQRGAHLNNNNSSSSNCHYAYKTTTTTTNVNNCQWVAQHGPGVGWQQQQQQASGSVNVVVPMSGYPRLNPCFDPRFASQLIALRRGQLEASVDYYRRNPNLLNSRYHAERLHYQLAMLKQHEHEHETMLPYATNSQAQSQAQSQVQHYRCSPDDHRCEYEWRFGRIIGNRDGEDTRRVAPAVTYIVDFNDPTICDWIDLNLYGANAVGIDVTWQPSSEPSSGQIAIVQIATRRAILVLHIAMMPAGSFSAETLELSLPNLYDVLCSESSIADLPTLVGYNAHRHAERLFECCGVRLRPIVDISHATCGLRRAEIGTPGPNPSLSQLALEYLGATTTPPSPQFADRVWERTPLSPIERWFAAEGAWVSLEIHETLCVTHGAQAAIDAARSEGIARSPPMMPPHIDQLTMPSSPPLQQPRHGAANQDTSKPAIIEWGYTPSAPPILAQHSHEEDRLTMMTTSPQQHPPRFGAADQEKSKPTITIQWGFTPSAPSEQEIADELAALSAFAPPTERANEMSRAAKEDSGKSGAKSKATLTSSYRRRRQRL